MQSRWRELCAAAMLVSCGAAAFASASADSGADRGAQVYATFCGSCHGRYGRGDGPLAANLTARPRDFTDSAWLAGRSDDEIVKGLLAGSHPAMAVATVLEVGALRDAVAYVRTLSVPGKHVSLAEGRDIYRSVCFVCHGPDGDGKGPAATNIQGPKPRDFTSPDFAIAGREHEIARTISLGAEASFHGSPLMPAWASHLSPQQIQGLVEYLKTFQKR